MDMRSCADQQLSQQPHGLWKPGGQRVCRSLFQFQASLLFPSQSRCGQAVMVELTGVLMLYQLSYEALRPTMGLEPTTSRLR